LWGGGIAAKKICWVKWDQICLPKARGGLGVKNLDLFNLALLGKWKWRFLNDSGAVWADLLRFRYDHLPTILMGNQPLTSSPRNSIWWRDVIGYGRGQQHNWFTSNVSCRVGDGNNIEFWKFKWYGNQPLCDLFPELYGKEVHKGTVISERLVLQGTDTSWRWQWNGGLNAVEQNQLEDLIELIDVIPFHSTCSDSWRWVPDTNGMFSVISLYNLLLAARQTKELNEPLLAALKKLWKSDIPSKILVFGWRLLLNRLPTRAALARRGVLANTNELQCVFCNQNEEDSIHLFFSCPFSQGVWNDVSQWIGKAIPTGLEPCDHFMLFGDLFKLKDDGKIRFLVWLATTWNVWNLRNKVIFYGVTPEAATLLEDIKISS
jgi:hypothetical protein